MQHRSRADGGAVCVKTSLPFSRETPLSECIALPQVFEVSFMW